MSGPTDYGMRMAALDKAVNIAHIVGADAVVETAEKFLAFMNGSEKAEAADRRPLFKLPQRNDGFIYYRFWGLHIIYRADVSFGALEGGVDRIAIFRGNEWIRKGRNANKGTRHALDEDPDISMISAEEAARLIQKNMKGVRFE